MLRLARTLLAGAMVLSFLLHGPMMGVMLCDGMSGQGMAGMSSSRAPHDGLPAVGAVHHPGRQHQQSAGHGLDDCCAAAGACCSVMTRRVAIIDGSRPAARPVVIRLLPPVEPSRSLVPATIPFALPLAQAPPVSA
jgi:hypothetical protein